MMGKIRVPKKLIELSDKLEHKLYGTAYIGETEKAVEMFYQGEYMIDLTYNVDNHPVTKVVIPDGVTSVFVNNTKISELILPESVNFVMANDTPNLKEIKTENNLSCVWTDKDKDLYLPNTKQITLWS